MRHNLAHHIADRVRNLIADGDLGSGERINEVALAQRLEVSRTPLREALSRLSAEGFVDVRPRRGFYVQELRTAGAAELYGVRAILDPAALELAGVPSAGQLERLAVLNGSIGAAEGDVERVIDLDDDWHRELLAHCPNRVLVSLIEQLMGRTRPLERAYLRDHASVRTMMREHTRIARALGKGDLPEAVAALRQNMESGIGPILRWLERERPTHERMRR